MIEIYINYTNNQIMGYNTIINNDNGDHIFIEGEDEEIVIKNVMSGRLFYIDGKVELKDSVPSRPSIEIELEKVSTKISELENLTSGKNEYKTFMNNIIGGMSVEDAAKISKENRNKLEELIQKRNKILEDINEEEEQGKLRIFEEEEANIDYKYFLSVVTIVRDENPYLEEWIRYHIEEIGVEHFYIYDNESAVPVKDYLESINFKHLDKCTIIDFPTTEWSQQDSHNQFLNDYGKKETKWFIGIDPDEYVLIKDKSKSLIEFLNENSDYTAIKCIWKHYNANGHEKKTNEPDMVRFTQETDWNDYKHGGKMFAQSNRISGFGSYVPLRRMESKIAEFENKELTVDFMQLNHYYTRSYDEWVEKIKRGSSNPTFFRKYSEFFELNPDMKYLDTGEDYEQGYGTATANI